MSAAILFLVPKAQSAFTPLIAPEALMTRNRENRYKSFRNGVGSIPAVESITVNVSVKSYREKLQRGVESFWIPPVCPRCFGILSQKMASNRLVCLVCGAEFELHSTSEAGNSHAR